MKKSLILTIAAISAVSCLGLVSCGEVSFNSSSISIGEHTSMSITNKADLTAEWRLADADRQIKFSFAPEANVNTLLNAGALTIVSSNADNVSVIGTYISAKAIGSSTITATLGSLTDSFDVTVGPVKPIGKSTKTIEELIPIISAQTDKVVDNTNIYTVTGTAMNIVNSAYGNFDLYNDDFTKHLTVYGSTTTASALEIQKVLDVEATASFTNPKDFVYGTTIHDGDKFTMTVLAEKYGSTNEIMGIIDASTISLSTTRTTFTASVNTPENGTAALSKTEGIYIGEPITCTATPAEGYDVASVKVNGTAVTADASDATKYVFNASNVNEVVVTFAEHVDAVGVVPATNLLTGKAADESVSLTGMQVYIAGGSTAGYVVLANTTGYVLVYTGYKASDGEDPAMTTLRGATKGEIYDISGKVGSYNDASYLGSLTACTANTTAERKNYSFTSSDPLFGDYADTTKATATVQKIIDDASGIAAKIVTIKNVQIAKYSSYYYYFEIVGGTEKFSIAKSATNTKVVSMGIYGQNDLLAADYAGGKVYDLTCMVYGYNKKMSSTSDNTICRVFVLGLTEVVA